MTLGFKFKQMSRANVLQIYSTLKCILDQQYTEESRMSELKVRTVHRGRQHVRIESPYSAPRKAAY